MSDRVYEIVTERICELLENGTVPWHQPWNAELGMPRSLSTGKLYRGVNVWLLGSSMYASPWWGTYKHIAERGGQVRKGERSTLVVFWKRTERTVIDEQTGDETERKGFILRYYRVFNAEQCDGLQLPEIPAASCTTTSRSRPPRRSSTATSAAPAPAPGRRRRSSVLLAEPDVLRMPRRETFETAGGVLLDALSRDDALDRPCQPAGSQGPSRVPLVRRRELLPGGAGGRDGSVDAQRSRRHRSGHAAQLRRLPVALDPGPRRAIRGCVVTAAAQAQRAADCITGVEHSSGRPCPRVAA